MKIVSNFSHTPGVHCGSTALRDLLGYIGLDYSEPMCFGLGSGLGFIYYHTDAGTTPSHNIYGRTITLERDLCQHLALDWEEGVDDDPAHAWAKAKEWLDRDVPLLLYVELSQLPYYRTRTPFPGHRVIVAGYDDERQVALLADTQFPGLQPISYTALAAARSAKIPPIPLNNEWLAIKPTSKPRPLGEAIRLALRDNALGMNLDRAPHQGIMGMEMLAEDFESWGEYPDWAFCVRLAYQNIEVRGTGGGMFRRIYVQFLQEAASLDKQLEQAQLATNMQEIADEWTGLAVLLQRASAEKERKVLAEASRAIRRLAMREENFWGRVLDLLA